MLFRILLFFSFYSFALADEVLTSVADIRDLKEEEAAGVPVEVEVQVMKVGLALHGFFGFDGDVGIYVRMPGKIAHRLKPTQGEVFKVTGVTRPGYFMPDIDARELTKLGSRPLPEPQSLNRETIYSPEIDCLWVSLEGVVTGSVVSDRVLSLRLAWQDQVFNLALPNTQEVRDAAPKLLNQMIRFRGVAATRWNSRRQMTGRLFQLHSLEDIELISDGNSAVPFVKIDELLLRETRPSRIVRLRGTVTHSSGDKLYLQDSSGALLVVMGEAASFSPGEVVEIEGTVTPSDFAPTFRASSVRRNGITETPMILELQHSDPPYPVSWHHALVSAKVLVQEVEQLENSLHLKCLMDKTEFTATLDAPWPHAEKLNAGSMVLLRGICLLGASDADAHFFVADQMQILPRSAKDIELLDPPGWWNPRRILIFAAVSTTIGLVALGWILLLRRQVHEQTKQIHHQVEREVTLRERERLARDLHDSFQQNISGLARQLGTIQTQLKGGEPAAIDRSVFLAKRMADHCQKESRESRAELRVQIGRQQHTFDSQVERHIARIVREAVRNALHHGHAKTITISREEDDNIVIISIEDDGCGFDPHNDQKHGHFGIIGMKERAERIDGEIEITSTPAKGTRVRLTIPTK